MIMSIMHLHISHGRKLQQIKQQVFANYLCGVPVNTVSVKVASSSAQRP